MAALVVWLVVQEPVTMADAVASGQYEPLLAALAEEVQARMARP